MKPAEKSFKVHHAIFKKDYTCLDPDEGYYVENGPNDTEVYKLLSQTEQEVELVYHHTRRTYPVKELHSDSYPVTPYPFTMHEQAYKPADDPWKHRSDGMKCKTCMWFVPKDKSPELPIKRFIAVDLGRCRRHAPTINGFPAVFVNDWCGDHKIDENKI